MGTTATRRGEPVPRTAVPFISRELSWLDFNERVLYQAEDPHDPLLERVRFLAIFASNLDEFFQVRVAGLKQQVAAGHSRPTPDGFSASEKLDRIRGRVLQLQAQHSDVYTAISEELAAAGIRVLPLEDRPERQLELRRRFMDEIFPVLTPLAVDPSHPFPYISDLSLSLAVTVREPVSGQKRFARVKVPPVLPRMWEVAPLTYVLLERVIAANLDTLFPGMEIVSHHLFRVTRNADLYIEEDEADDLLMAMEEELRRRRFGNVVRLEVERSMPHETRTLLQRGLGLEPADVYEVRGMLDLRGLESIADLDIPSLQPVPYSPVTPPRLLPREEEDDDRVDVFARIREGDVFVHHPYESFVNSVQRFIQQAAADPDVLTIKMTLYRTSGNSPIVHALIDAAESGKQVVVMVEIKARFDERANIVWARALERAGAHVAYGLLGLKTHSKCALVIRREAGGLRRYAHIGTGNYNTRTARIYTDMGLLTADHALTADVTESLQRAQWRGQEGQLQGAAGGPSDHPFGDRGAHRRGDRATQGARRRSHPHQVQRHRGPGHGGRAVPGQPGRRAHRPHRPRHVLPAAGCPRLQRIDPRPLHRGPLPGALTLLLLRPGRAGALLHRLGGPHGAQPGPAYRGHDPHQGRHCPGAHPRSARDHAPG